MHGLDHLARELNTADSVGRFLPHLSLSPNVRLSPGRCAECCHWSLPLNPPYRGRDLLNGAAMRYDEWFVYHVHVVQHQRTPLLS